MLVFDAETNGLLPELDRIHCLWIEDTQTGRIKGYDKKDTEIGLQRLLRADTIAGHNIMGFDLPAFKQVHPWWNYDGYVIDTLVWSQTACPDIKEWDFGLFKKGHLPGRLIGSHSLEAWGHRLGAFKGAYGKTANWRYWTPEMSEYCRQDVKVTVKLVEFLRDYCPIDWEIVDKEMQVHNILLRQEWYGFYFDTQKAEELHQKLTCKQAEVGQKLREVIPVVWRQEGELIPKRSNKAKGYIKGCPLSKIKQEDFNPNSRHQVVRFLQDKYGWEPVEYTEKGN